MLTPEEIEHGLVVRFDPAILACRVARTERLRASTVLGVHYFVCTVRVTGVSVWIPAFTRWLPGRIKLRWKGGERAWVEHDSFVELTQQWLVPDCAVVPASVGHESTRRAHRNRASLFFLLGQHLEGRERSEDGDSGTSMAA